MPTNTDLEMRWINAWSDLDELLRANPTAPCQLAEGTIVSIEDCKAWLQTSAYQGYHIRVEPGRVNGRPGVIASRSMP